MSASQAQAVPTFGDVAPVQLPQPIRLRILFAVMVGIFLAALDQFVVGTALPVIVTDLKGNNVYTWVFTAYLLTATISGPIYGKLSDLYGRRPIFLLGIGIFLIGSTLAGFSQSIEWLIVSRGIQGLGAGALFPIALAIIGDIFAPSERGKYQGLFGAVFGISIIIGPAIGGLLTDTRRLAVGLLGQPARRCGRHLPRGALPAHIPPCRRQGPRSTTSAPRCLPRPSCPSWWD